MDAVLGTAGHIDHGKTSLVRALTGINCDRLEEEKRRGITIELGFAWLDMPDGRRLGIVDVPGHERFVKAMVAGASGIDCMMLVIAADEGIMPQTREHLDICALLGVRSGIVALTKTDMVDEDWLEMVKEDISANLRGTFLENAPVIPVSSATGSGIEALREAVFKLVASLPPRFGTDILRLPVDRVFTLKGFGTVVTGTLVSGSCRQGDEIALMPGGKTARARSLQVHGKAKEEAHAGQRCAMNLQGIEVADIGRGDTVCHPGQLFPARRWILNLACLPSAPLPLRQRMEIHFHHGSRECSARVVFRDRNELLQGETAIAELHFSQPMAGIFGDHCVIRSHSPLRAIGGGVLLDPLPTVLRKRDPLFPQKFALYQKLASLAETSANSQDGEIPLELTRLALSLREAPGADEKRLAVLTGLPSNILAASLESLAKAGEAICWDAAGKSWIGKKTFETSLENCLIRARDLHEREPLKNAFAQKSLFSGWGEGLPPKFAQKVLEEAVNRGLLKVDGNGVKLADHEICLDENQERLLGKFLDIYEKNGFAPPFLKELCEALNVDQKTALPIHAHMCERGELIRIQDGVYYHKPALEKILSLAREWFKTHDNLDVGGMKTMLDVSRKYAIPLLEYMDGAGITYRVGNFRRLRGSPQERK